MCKNYFAAREARRAKNLGLKKKVGKFLRKNIFSLTKSEKNRKKLMSKNEFYKVLVLAQIFFDPP